MATSLLDYVEQAKTPRKAISADVIKIGITKEEAIKLIKGEIDRVTIERGNTTHTITKVDDEHLMARVEFSAPFSAVVAPAYNGNNSARIFFSDNVSGKVFDGSTLVLTEKEAGELFSNGATAHDKDGHWEVVLCEDRQSVRINGGLSEGQRFQYNCPLIPDCDERVIRG